MEQIKTSRRSPFSSNPTVGEAGLATQQRILVAATEAFAEAGYARTSVEVITDRAGCSRPTFYQYFSGKEDLHRRLAARLGSELSELLGRLDPVTPDAAGRAALYDWIHALTEVYERNRAVANVFSASLRTDDQMVAGAAAMSAQYGRTLLGALDPDVTATADLEVMANVANATAYGACIYRDRIGEVSAARLADALADALHRTFFGSITGVNIAAAIASTPIQISRPATDSASSPEPAQRGRGVETRRRLVDAALTAYEMLGFDAVRVDDIVAEAGVSHGTFYRYFRDKEEVFDEHADRASSDVAQLLAQLPVRAGDFAGWASSYYDLYRRDGGIIGCLRDARAAGVESAIRARHDMATALGTAFDQRPFGDTDADIIICFSLLENVPAAAFGYSRFSTDQAAKATATLLGQGLFAAS